MFTYKVTGIKGYLSYNQLVELFSNFDKITKDTGYLSDEIKIQVFKNIHSIGNIRVYIYGDKDSIRVLAIETKNIFRNDEYNSYEYRYLSEDNKFTEEQILDMYNNRLIDIVAEQFNNGIISGLDKFSLMFDKTSEKVDRPTLKEVPKNVSFGNSISLVGKV